MGGYVAYVTCFFAARTHFSLYLCRLKISHPNQDVGGRRRGEHPAHPSQASEARLSLQGHGLHPSEDLFISFPFALTDRIAVMSCRTVINGAVLMIIVLRHMRRDIQFPCRFHKPGIS